MVAPESAREKRAPLPFFADILDFHCRKRVFLAPVPNPAPVTKEVGGRHGS